MNVKRELGRDHEDHAGFLARRGVLAIRARRECASARVRVAANVSD